MAWSNTIYDASGKAQKVDGCVLLLDELPKIDPNTAGLLNDALAKIKPTKKDPTRKGMWERPKIRNGKGQLLELGNLFVIATGNVPLNTIDPDYEANFKQDLSLQDRFIGSTYKVKINFQYELENIMAGYAFIWIFLSKVRLSIAKNKAGGQAFVSLRIMINARETYRYYRDNLEDQKSGFKDLITSPKTLINTMDALFDLFKPAIKDKIISDVDYDGFKKILKEKDKMPYKHSKLEQSNDFNTKAEMTESVRLIDEMTTEL
jgi:cobaltochelatase CobS